MLSLRDDTIFFFTDESLVVRELKVVARFTYVLWYLDVLAARSTMASTVLSAFPSREFAKGYILPANDGCVSFQDWYSSTKKGLNISHVFSDNGFVFQSRQESLKFPVENTRLQVVVAICLGV